MKTLDRQTHQDLIPETSVRQVEDGWDGGS